MIDNFISKQHEWKKPLLYEPLIQFGTITIYSNTREQYVPFECFYK